MAFSFIYVKTKGIKNIISQLTVPHPFSRHVPGIFHDPLTVKHKAVHIEDDTVDISFLHISAPFCTDTIITVFSLFCNKKNISCLWMSLLDK